MAYLDGQLVQGTGPEVYVIESGQRRWIPDPRTFDLLGYNWNAILHIPEPDLEQIPTGPQIEAVAKLEFPAPWDTPQPGNGLWQYNGSLWGRYLSSGGGHTVLGKCEMDLSTGHINGEVVAANGVFALGFHGGMTGLAVDANGIVLAATPVFKIGVDAAWGSGPRWSQPAPWAFDFGAAVGSKTQRLSAFVTDVPEDLQYILDHDVNPLVTEIEKLLPLVMKIVSIFTGKPSTSASTNPFIASPAADPSPSVLPKPLNVLGKLGSMDGGEDGAGEAGHELRQSAPVGPMGERLPA